MARTTLSLPIKTALVMVVLLVAVGGAIAGKRFSDQLSIEAMKAEAQDIARAVRLAYRSRLTYAGVSLADIRDENARTSGVALSAIDGGGGPASGFSIGFSGLSRNACVQLAAGAPDRSRAVDVNGSLMPFPFAASLVEAACSSDGDNAVSFHTF